MLSTQHSLHPTVMLKVAIVCCTPGAASASGRSAIFTGCRIDLMPTLLMAILRVSAEPCTSTMGAGLLKAASRVFI